MAQTHLLAGSTMNIMRATDNPTVHIKEVPPKSIKHNSDFLEKRTVDLCLNQSDRFFLHKKTPAITQLWRDKDNKKRITDFEYF